MFVTFILLLQSHLMGIEFLNSHRALDLVWKMNCDLYLEVTWSWVCN
jgi:hypothetical protein